MYPSQSVCLTYMLQEFLESPGLTGWVICVIFHFEDFFQFKNVPSTDWHYPVKTAFFLRVFKAASASIVWLSITLL